VRYHDHDTTVAVNFGGLNIILVDALYATRNGLTAAELSDEDRVLVPRHCEWAGTCRGGERLFRMGEPV